MEEKIVIKLEELPPRAEKLSQEKIVNIFGGCKDKTFKCNKGSDCCTHYCTKISQKSDYVCV